MERWGERSRETPRASREASELVHAAGELHCLGGSGVDAVGACHLCKHVLELVGHAERDEIREAAHGQQEDVPLRSGTNWASP